MTEYRKNMHSAIIHLLGLICKYFMSEQWLTHRDLGDRYMWHKSKFIFIYLCIYLKSTATELESEWQTQGERSFICWFTLQTPQSPGRAQAKGTASSGSLARVGPLLLLSQALSRELGCRGSSWDSHRHAMDAGTAGSSLTCYTTFWPPAKGH